MPGGRVIGRILSLGFPLPGTHVDNYNVLNAPALFDYDALIVEPYALTALVERIVASTEDAATFSGAPVRNHPTTPGDAALGELLLQRREEARLLLENGGLIVAFLQPAVRLEVTRAGDLDSYFWLPDPIAMTCRPPSLVAAAGTQAQIVDFRHPLAPFVQSQLAHVEYHAYFAAGSVPPGRVFVRSKGGAAIGAELAAASGRVIMLPALKALPAGEARYAASDALQAGIRHALGAMAAGREPSWATAFVLPGLGEREAGLAEAQRALDAAETARNEAAQARDELARYRRLLWQEGALGLHDVVLDALRLIGFEVYAQNPNALELRHHDATLMLEIAASEHPIDLAAHYRLRQRIEEAIAQRGQAPRGLLVINGQRLTAPAERSQEASDALRLAADTMRYGIATTPGLFAAVAAQLGGDDAAVSAYRCRLLSDVGLIA
jgi:hypothetical protein